MHTPLTPLRWLHDDRGVTSIEYALLGSLIAMTILSSVVVLGGGVQSLYNGIAQKVAAAIATK